MKGNKGEWSEIYTLLKTLSDKSLFAGDEYLNIIDGLVFPIINVLREESNGTYVYSYDNDLVLIKGANNEFKIPISEFHRQSEFLYKKLKESKTASFSVPEIEKFINSFNCSSLKAKSNVKSDIRIVIHDYRTGTTPLLGFSIKSQLGGASTLLNAGKTTNFIYKIAGNSINENKVKRINAINTTRGAKTSRDIQGRIRAILENNSDLLFHKNENNTFQNNQTLIDSALPKIIAEMLLFYFSTSSSKISELIDLVSKKNPLDFDLNSNHPFYLYKVKRFLTDIALGMMPSKVWTGQLEATGGYLVVKEDGDILCYHIYNRNEFEDYLLNNTKFETASSSRHNFGEIYKEGNDLFFKLNLQIRFLK